MALIAVVVFVLLILSVPIGIALSGAALAYIAVDPLLEPTVVFRAFFNFISKYTLMAIPLFIFAGFLMERTGLVGLLFRFADALVGWLPGGFGIATILACVIFAAISGSSVAMAAAMSVIAIPEMLKRGYPPWVAAGLVATSGGIGGMRLRAALRSGQPWHGVHTGPAGRALPLAQPYRGNSLSRRLRRRVPVPRRESLLAADGNQDGDVMGPRTDGLHLRLHRPGNDPRLLRRRRGDDPAHHPGDLPGGARAAYRSHSPRH